MNLQVLGANRTQVTHDNGVRVFFSYSTPVAVVLPGKGWVRTDKNWSRTTAKHIGQFGCPADAPRKPQAWFDDDGWNKPDSETLQLTRINSDSNGNPRYVCHFLQLNTRAELDAQPWLEIGVKYGLAVKRANAIGGRKFSNKTYGGGIVFSSYSVDELATHVSEVTGRRFVASVD